VTQAVPIASATEPATNRADFLAIIDRTPTTSSAPTSNDATDVIDGQPSGRPEDRSWGWPYRRIGISWRRP
jgi:hypothetical protein